MKILSASQIRLADAHTIEHEPVASIDLMERAASACVTWIKKNLSSKNFFKIFCGPGNNGGDGLAITRLLLDSGFKAEAFIIGGEEKKSPDFLENEKRLKKIAPGAMHDIHSENDLPAFQKEDCIVDALFGTGLSRPLMGLYAVVIRHINEHRHKVISIDMPSGLYPDTPAEGHVIVQADHTLSFQVPKLVFMFSESELFAGQFHVLDIGLDDKYIEGLPSSGNYITKDLFQSFLKPRTRFSHKGKYGHALIIAGSKGKMGAAVLAVKGCLRTGAGLVSARIPETGNNIMQVSCPEAMIADDEIDFEKYTAIGIGPGIGTGDEPAELLKSILQSAKAPLVLDADALNIISVEKELLNQLPVNTILTPHPKEFERLAGKSENGFERHERQLAFSKNHKVIVVLKGAHTCITTPEGNSYFNSTGNAGMAKGGSGDVLTGMITSLLAQKYESLQAALLGVFLHGLAGDIAAEKKGMDGMIARDVVNGIPGAWKEMRNR